jgi:hypothetical protein
MEAEIGYRSTAQNVKGVVQWSNKNGTPLPQVLNEYNNQWPGQGFCFDAAATSESCIMVDLPKKCAEGHLDQKKKECTPWRSSNKSQKMIIPGMGKVGCQRIGLGSFGRGGVR